MSVGKSPTSSPPSPYTPLPAPPNLRVGPVWRCPSRGGPIAHVQSSECLRPATRRARTADRSPDRHDPDAAPKIIIHRIGSRSQPSADANRRPDTTMKQSLRILALGLAAGFLLVAKADAQCLQALQNYRSPSQDGLNVFEAPKEAADEDMDHIFLRPGGDFAIQFQALEQENDLDNLVELAPNLTLPSANLNIDVQFTPGVRMHLRTYLSSKHHNEAWVKGGYFRVDVLNFIQDGFLSDVMQYTRVRVGMDEINYGDTHFRRSDNAGALFNPFVENYIMDSFTTEPFAEVTVMKDGFLGVAGVSNGRLNQTPTPGDDGVALFGKLGYDRQVSDDVRVRLTGSIYHSTKESTRDYLYNGDRAGSRYHKVLNTEEITNDFMPRFNP